ncbi:actin depolymerization factor/cofilin- and gelsolin-like domain-containing protein [Pseudomonas sp. S1_E04]
MSRRMLGVLLALGITGLTGCVGKQVDSFTLEVDLPAEFKLKTAANYYPATGEMCTLPRRRGKRPERKVFFTEYEPAASRVSYKLPLSETVEGCPLVLRSVEFDFYAKWGTRSSDVGGDIGGISIRDRLEDEMAGMPESGVQELLGQCQWLFRTVGRQHAIIKVLKCNSLEVSRQSHKGRAGGVLARDELGGKTVRVKMNVINEERPYMGDNWVRFPQGWKRCRGESFEDLYAFCRGNTTDFKPIKMPDGRICDIYPTCTE